VRQKGRRTEPAAGGSKAAAGPTRLAILVGSGSGGSGCDDVAVAHG
jgi:hypothetical protein